MMNNPSALVPPIQIGPFHVNMYGVMFAAAFLTGWFLATKILKQHGEKWELANDLVLYLMAGGILGARIFYVISYWPEGQPFSFFWDFFTVWKGGLAWYGGFIGAIIAGAVFIRKHRLLFRRWADLMAVPLISGHFLGRTGDALTGGHPGKEASAAWLRNLGITNHPVVVYEMTGLVIIGAILLLLLYGTRILRRKGWLFHIYIILYAFQRLFLDIFRMESTDPRIWGLTPTQILTLFLVVYGFIFLLATRRTQKPDSVRGAA